MYMSWVMDIRWSCVIGYTFDHFPAGPIHHTHEHQPNTTRADFTGCQTAAVEGQVLGEPGGAADGRGAAEVWEWLESGGTAAVTASPQGNESAFSDRETREQMDMRQDLTDITLLIDRSGSMASIREDVAGGVASFIEQQKTASKSAGQANLTLIQFDSQDSQEVVISAKDIRHVTLAKDWFSPRGGTPLCDAMGIAITRTGQRLAEMPENERPARVVFVVFTDGEENQSREYTGQKVAEMVKHQEQRYNWQFMFLGAGIDAIGQAAIIGVAASNSVSNARSKTKRAIELAGSKLACYRSVAPIDKGVLAYNSQERDELK